MLKLAVGREEIHRGDVEAKHMFYTLFYRFDIRTWYLFKIIMKQKFLDEKETLKVLS